MLESWQVSHFYINADLQVPRLWNLSWKHVHVRTLDGRVVKLNKHRSRLSTRALRDLHHAGTLQRLLRARPAVRV
jgi:hypothetical protein